MASKTNIKVTNEEFIKRAKDKFGDLYDYSKTQYIDAIHKVEIVCKQHSSFFQIPNDHLKSSGCPKCSLIEKGKRKIQTVEEFIEKSSRAHDNKYDYSRVRPAPNNLQKEEIGCPVHGFFLQRRDSHSGGAGCSKCATEATANEQRKSLEQFIKEDEGRWGVGEYDYSNSIYINCDTKIEIICRFHGSFWQKPSDRKVCRGCPKCSGLESKGEERIRSFLENNNIGFEQEKRFKGCRIKLPMRFDFYLYKHNLLIEFDGQLHFKSVPYYGGDEGLKYRQAGDAYKTQWAKDSGIDLLRIPYTEFDNIDQILSSHLFPLNSTIPSV